MEFILKNIISDSIFSKEEINKSMNLYIGGIGVLESDTFDGQRNAAILIRAMVKYIKTFYDLKLNENYVQFQQQKTEKSYC